MELFPQIREFGLLQVVNDLWQSRLAGDGLGSDCNQNLCADHSRSCDWHDGICSIGIAQTHL